MSDAQYIYALLMADLDRKTRMWVDKRVNVAKADAALAAAREAEDELSMGFRTSALGNDRKRAYDAVDAAEKEYLTARSALDYFCTHFIDEASDEGT